MKTFTLAIATVAGLAAGAASAATVGDSGSLSVSNGTWSDTLELMQFDSSLGTLTSVALTMTGSVSGTARVESLDSVTPGTVNYALSALLNASVSGAGSLTVSINPLAMTTFSATVFDGVQDYAGTSGFTNASLTNTDTDTSVFTTGLAPFIGTGTFTLDVDATATSFASGPGDMASIFNTNSGTTLSVLYTYTPSISEVPLPAGAPLLIGALGGLALVRRRKAKKAA